MTQPLDVVTGALGYSGKAIAERLFARGRRARTLTNSPNRPNPFGDSLEIRPLAFDDPDALARSLEGAGTLGGRSASEVGRRVKRDVAYEKV